MSGFDASQKVRVWYDPTTNERGIQVRVTNKTGGTATKGYAVEPYPSADNAVQYAAINEPDPIGIVYEAAAADAEMWIWIAGIVEVYVNASATRGQFVRVPATGDSVTTSGTLTNEAQPSSPFATDKHFQEVGHVMKDRTGAGLTLVVLHWN